MGSTLVTNGDWQKSLDQSYFPSCVKMNETDKGITLGPFEEDVFLGTFDSK